MQQAESLAQRVGHPHAVGLVTWARGITAYVNGRWKNAAQLCEQAAEILRDQCTGVTWELSITHRFLFSAMVYLGEIGEVSRRVPSLLAAALEDAGLPVPSEQFFDTLTVPVPGRAAEIVRAVPGTVQNLRTLSTQPRILPA